MPYGKKTKAPYKKRPARKATYKPKLTVAAVSRRVSKLAKEPETKCWSYLNNFAFGTSATTALIQTSPFSLLLNSVDPGTEGYQRTGDKFRQTSVHISGTVYPTAAPGIGIDCLVRVLIVLYKDPRGKSLQVCGNLMSATLGPPLFYAMPGNPVWPQMQFNVGNDDQGSPMESYTVIYDKKYRLANFVGTSITGPVNSCVNPSINFDIKRKLGQIVDCSLGDAAQTPANFQSNSLWLVVTTETNTQLTMKLNTKVFFKDT